MVYIKMKRLTTIISEYWSNFQNILFPHLEESLGPLTEKQQQLITILEVIKIEDYLPRVYSPLGRPAADRGAMARAFIAKSIYNIPTTSMLIERLKSDKSLRRICGWESIHKIPSEASFSRAYREFSESALPTTVHNAVIQYHYENQLIGHVSRDSTAIEVREKPIKKEKKAKIVRKPGRPKKGESVKKEKRRIEKQLTMTEKEMIDDLPKLCDVGTKKDSKGNKQSWVGYKLHIDSADGHMAISCILTSASLHDSQVAIPLATQTSKKIVNLYDLMDSAYDASEIYTHSASLGHIPLIDKNTRRNNSLKEEINAEKARFKLINFITPENQRYKERSNAERVNSRLKDEFGGRFVRVRGHAKVLCHLMFGILALTADQLLKFAT